MVRPAIYDPNRDSSAQEEIILQGSGTGAGSWYAIDNKAEQTFQVYAKSGTGVGTFSGTVNVEITLSDDAIATASPEVVKAFTSAGVWQNTTRTRFVRGNAPTWVGDEYVLIMRAYERQ